MNKVVLVGKINKEVSFSYEFEGEKFFKTELKIQRKNPEAFDYIPVVIAESMLFERMDIGSYLYISGEYRSRNEWVDGKSKLVLYVFAQEIDVFSDEQNSNGIELSGYICKKPVKRQTPGGRIICDLLLAVNRPCDRTDYIPLIVWGRQADAVALMDCGKELHIKGRIQSRTYKKLIDNIEETHTAYEVSVVEVAK